MLTRRQSISRSLQHINLGLADFKETWELQKQLMDKRLRNEIPDTLLLLEHPHTYTLGKVADRNNLIGTYEYLQKHDIKVYDIDRGGDITYHGPGQIVGYPIINLKEWKMDTHLYLRSLEEVLINVCKEYNIATGRKDEYTGVWIDERKICAIGIKVSRWITMHGFAFNVNTDLSFFNGIIPCGITDKEVTSLNNELKKEVKLNEVFEKIINNFKNVFEYDEVVQEKLNTKKLENSI